LEAGETGLKRALWREGAAGCRFRIGGSKTHEKTKGVMGGKSGVWGKRVIGGKKNRPNNVDFDTTARGKSRAGGAKGKGKTEKNMRGRHCKRHDDGKRMGGTVR